MSSSARESHRNEHLMLKAIYHAIPQMGVEVTASVEAIAANAPTPLPIKSQHTRKYVVVFERLGILKRRYVYGTGENLGKTSMWTILVDFDTAERLLYKDQDARLGAELAARSGPKKPRVKKAEPIEEVVSIVGDDAPTMAAAMSKAVLDLRKDDAGALIEAARQYHNRNHKAKEKIKELADVMKELGIKFDEEKATSALHFEEDERLEAISLVLPYIERLERTNERLASQIGDQRDKVREYDAMKAENTRLVRRVETLVSQRVTAAQALQA